MADNSGRKLLVWAHLLGWGLIRFAAARTRSQHAQEADPPDGSDGSDMLRRLRPLQLHAILQARQYVRAFEAKKLAEASEQWSAEPAMTAIKKGSQ